MDKVVDLKSRQETAAVETTFQNLFIATLDCRRVTNKKAFLEGYATAREGLEAHNFQHRDYYAGYQEGEELARCAHKLGTLDFLFAREKDTHDYENGYSGGLSNKGEKKC
tara:strand:- start:267 stop:596 length:330 start_codon:yes stop_codon:yes gene_type:complete